jgi:hypothetical protein
MKSLPEEPRCSFCQLLITDTHSRFLHMRAGEPGVAICSRCVRRFHADEEIEQLRTRHRRLRRSATISRTIN